MRQYKGKLGPAILRSAVLDEMAKQGRSAAMTRGGHIIWVLPASSLLNRQYKDVRKMLDTGELHEYIKPEQQRPQRILRPKQATPTQQRNEALAIAQGALAILAEVCKAINTTARQQGIDISKQLARCTNNLQNRYYYLTVMRAIMPQDGGENADQI